MLHPFLSNYLVYCLEVQILRSLNPNDSFPDVSRSSIASYLVLFEFMQGSGKFTFPGTHMILVKFWFLTVQITLTSTHIEQSVDLWQVENELKRSHEWNTSMKSISTCRIEVRASCNILLFSKVSPAARSSAAPKNSAKRLDLW